MDWNYLYSVLSFLIGLIAGSQGIYDRYKRNNFRAALLSRPGILYLLIRGAIPAVVFTGLYAGKIIQDRIWMYSVGCGVAAEAILRSKFYLKERQKPDGGGIEEQFFGGFDLLHWLQTTVLENIGDYLAESRQQFVARHLPTGNTFNTLYDRVIDNLEAYPPDQQITIQCVQTAAQKVRREFEAKLRAGGDTKALERKYSFKLGYQVLNCAGQRGFNTLFSPSLTESQTVPDSSTPRTTRLLL